MAKYIGNSVVVEFGTIDVSGQYTSVEVNEEAPESNRIDVSDKSSTEIETVEGLPGEPKSTVSVDANDVSGGTSTILSLSVNDQDTLIIYPEGKTHTYPMRTIQSARLGSRRLSGGYQDKVAWGLGFYAYETVTDSTYSTA